MPPFYYKDKNDRIRRVEGNNKPDNMIVYGDKKNVWNFRPNLYKLTTSHLQDTCHSPECHDFNNTKSKIHVKELGSVVARNEGEAKKIAERDYPMIKHFGLRKVSQVESDPFKPFE